MPWKDFFSNKRITLIGLGLLGRGVGDAAFLAGLGAELTVTDRKNKEDLASSLEQLKDFKNIRYVLGGHDIQDFQNADMVIKAAGVPLDSSYIQAARDRGVPVYMSTALFAKFARDIGAIVVGVTGTRGKSTVTHLIYHALKQAGRPVHLGGNVRGLSTLAMLPDVKKGDIVVLELDSWQLQGFGDLKLSPSVAVFTNLMPDHMNYYRDDMDAYFADKANIYKYQRAGDRLVAGDSIAERIRLTSPPVPPSVPPTLPETWKLKIIGEHNGGNAALAAEALSGLGLMESEIQRGLESFEPVEGRLQSMGEKNGISVYNDNNATTPEATSAALKALAGKKVVLIVGGADKGTSLDTLVADIKKYAGAVVLLPGTGTERLKKLLTVYEEVQSMEEAVKKAFSQAQSGDVILLSPGFASFGLFANEYERNDTFVRAVESIKN